jgi:uncharacterized integral membrane protein
VSLTGVFLVDAARRFSGAVTLVAAVQADPDTLLMRLVDPDPVRVLAEADPVQVTRLMADYNLLVPVVDAEDHLLGVITVDDAREAAIPGDWRQRQTGEPGTAPWHARCYPLTITGRKRHGVFCPKSICWQIFRRPRPFNAPTATAAAPAPESWSASRDPFAPPARLSPPAPDPDGDHRGSRRILLATVLLRRGDDPESIADITGVPIAMLELIRAHDRTPERDKDRGPEVGEDAGERYPHNRRTESPQGRSARARWVVIALVILEVVAVANVLACATALFRGSTDLGVLTGLVALALTGGVFLLARAARSPAPLTPTIESWSQPPRSHDSDETP